MKQSSLEHLAATDFAILRFEAISKRRVWGFLNSSFGLWVLSSVLIGGLGTIFTLTLQHMKDESEHQRRFHRLEAELSLRIQPLLIDLLRWDLSTSVSEPGAFEYFKRDKGSYLRRNLFELSPAAGGPPMCLPEYTSHSLRMLLAELAFISDDESHRETVVDTILDLDALIRAFEDEELPRNNIQVLRVVRSFLNFYIKCRVSIQGLKSSQHDGKAMLFRTEVEQFRDRMERELLRRMRVELFGETESEENVGELSRP